MSQMTVDVNLCAQDGACIAVCPTRALDLSEAGFPEEFDEEKCILCGQCIAVCGTGALTHSELPADSFEALPTAAPTAEQMDGLLKSRRSIRAFKDRPVSRDVVLDLLDVARRAPSAKNSQLLHWIVVEGREKMRALALETIQGIEPLASRQDFMEQWDCGEDRVLRGAPMVVVACAPTDYGWGVEDAAIALSYFELAAEARGIGICWAGYLMRVAAAHAPVQQLLNVPDGYAVRGALMVGESGLRYRRVPPRKVLSVQWC